MTINVQTLFYVFMLGSAATAILLYLNTEFTGNRDLNTRVYILAKFLQALFVPFVISKSFIGFFASEILQDIVINFVIY